MDKLLSSIKKSKKYSSISDDLIKEEIEKYFKINPKQKEYLKNEKSKKYKDIIKKIKNRLHLAHGSFQKDKGKREVYLKKIYGINDYDNHDEILSTSVSAKERLKEYQKIYKKIFNITGKPKKIVDLGCGLNPISYPYMGLNGINYYVYDIDQEDCDFLNKYFLLMKGYTHLKARAFISNLKKISEIKKIPKADICFMFKFLDVIEEKGHKLSEAIIKSINCKYIVVSFPTRTISGKNMKHPYRGWIEKMLERISLEYEKFSIDNEIFYIIKKV
jgi:16S rRNA (guanine(1405)-N(7))-methyltransferase